MGRRLDVFRVHVLLDLVISRLTDAPKVRKAWPTYQSRLASLKSIKFECAGISPSDSNDLLQPPNQNPQAPNADNNVDRQSEQQEAQDRATDREFRSPRSRPRPLQAKFR
nr:uncharacterized protein LOC114827776 [Malus domestica]